MTKTLTQRIPVTKPATKPEPAPVVRHQKDFDTLNLSRMSRATGLSVSHLSRVFSGQRQPSLEVAKTICKYLSIGLDDLDRFLSTRKKKTA